MSHPERKKHYIDPQIQGVLARRLVIHWVLFIVVTMVVAFCMQVLGNPMRPAREQARQVWLIHGPFFLVLIALLPVFVRDSIKLSHRFAGPIYRLRTTIRSIAEGNPAPQLKFRKTDYWHDLAEDFNTMVQRLSKGTDYLEEPAQETASQNEVVDQSAVG